ncbi:MULTISPECIES: hypothetical protein [unclassified Anaeromyxobacter]|uniref:hypothetical protein n=1 Tax=unclassified Anaeromyxobacter TaxID=2620896 RepID=UPI001F5AE1D8|nr:MULTISPECIES: hypothetical protein [unclassified Anaeromyxobacter]
MRGGARGTLALALAGALGAAAPGAAPAAEAAPGAGREADDPLGAHDGSRHALAAGPHATTFFSEEGSQYTFLSGSVGYLGSLGVNGPFVHLFALLPLQARQDGRVYATGDYYRRRSGGDFLVGWQWRWSVRADLEAEAGPGLHGTLVYLPGKPGYRDFSALPLGVGGGAILRWRRGDHGFSQPITVGAYCALAYDLYDPLRADDLAHGFTFSTGFLLGLGVAR